jgi:hypothetical protein
MNMQAKYDLHVQAERLAAELAAIEPRRLRLIRLFHRIDETHKLSDMYGLDRPSE